MPKYKKLKFTIDGFTPLTLPIGRLADYLRDLAALLGTEADAHFKEVEDGSAELVHLVPIAEYPVLRGRIVNAGKGLGPVEAVRGFQAVRRLLFQDKTTARFQDARDRKILEFPAPVAPQFGPVTQQGTLEGVLIKIGGRDETVPVHLQDGKHFYKCTCTRAKARDLAPHLFAQPIRVFGRGKWSRDDDGNWSLDNFQISDFEIMNDAGLPEVIERLRNAPESGWDDIHDPLAELERIRKGASKIQ